MKRKILRGDWELSGFVKLDVTLRKGLCGRSRIGHDMSGSEPCLCIGGSEVTVLAIFLYWLEEFVLDS